MTDAQRAYETFLHSHGAEDWLAWIGLSGRAWAPGTSRRARSW